MFRRLARVATYIARALIIKLLKSLLPVPASIRRFRALQNARLKGRGFTRPHLPGSKEASANQKMKIATLCVPHLTKAHLARKESKRFTGPELQRDAQLWQ